jgi:hypothetical protein
MGRIKIKKSCKGLYQDACIIIRIREELPCFSYGEIPRVKREDYETERKIL